MDINLPTSTARWRRVRALTATLLAAWIGVIVVSVWFAREMDARFFGWPFGFWLAAQGLPLAFLGIVWFYARRMRAMDEAYPPDSHRERG